MYIQLDKVQEDKVYVDYQFKVDVDIGLETTIWEAKYGFCKFNKKTEEFELDL